MPLFLPRKYNLCPPLHPKVPAADLDDAAPPANTAEYPLALRIVAESLALGGRCHALGQLHQLVVREDVGGAIFHYTVPRKSRSLQSYFTPEPYHASALCSRDSFTTAHIRRIACNFLTKNLLQKRITAIR